jgi:hypothetical protein
MLGNGAAAGRRRAGERRDFRIAGARGVRTLGGHRAARHALAQRFIDLDNPLQEVV